MKLSELRKRFLNYFEAKGHKKIASSDLVPHGDDSIMFTNAGMVQFKDTFLGLETRDYSATTSQKCLRAGGKHNDLENVGFTTRHQTFFEMLGNFSFGEYFKEGAIEYAWEFLTVDLKIPADKLWITVHETDSESESIWIDKIGVPKDRVARLGDEDNFWSMGDTGPCGPCSEIFYDYGEEYEGEKPSDGDTGDRYVEVWNLVFMEFNRDSKGKLTPLPNKCVDTGMGLERICSVMQNTGSNFEIDAIKRFKDEISSEFPEPNDQSLNVIADHIRAAFFLMSEDIYPSNEGRGYVLRRIIRRAIRHGYKMGLKEPFMHNQLNALQDIYAVDFPDEFTKFSKIKDILKEEETAFFKTLSAGIKIFEQNIPTKDSEKMSGEIAFKLHDTYGFPIDLTMTMASEKGFEIDQDLFNSLMQVQKEGSKKNSKFDVKDIVINPKLKSKFVGYSDARCEGQCIALFDEDGNEAKSIDKKGFALFSETPFYAESGGQVGDQGSVVGKEFDIRVVDCKKIGDFHLHHIVVEKGNIKLEDQATLFIDEERRKNIVNNHSATHLLHSALRKVLGDSVFQKGSLVTDEKLRFDFSHNKKLSETEISDVENLVNEQIQKSSETVVESMSFDQAIENGALAFFGDKYGDEVRVLKIGGDFSTELCGGTHVTNTSEIEGFIISNETSVSSGVRRIEAMTGSNLIEKSKDALNKLKKLSEMLNVPNEELETRVSDLLKENKKLKSSKKTEKSLSSETLLSESHLVDGKKGEVVVHSNASIEMLRRYADKSVKDAAVSFSILISTDDEKVSYIVTAKQNEKFSAKDLIQLVNTAFNGSGGGRDDFAQGGSQEAGDIENKFNALNINLQSLI